MENQDDKVHTVSGAEAEKILARGQAPEINPDTGLPIGLKAVSKPPKKNCKKCYGRGHIGWIDGDMTKPYPCMCTIEITLDLPEPEPEKTATEPVGGEMPKESPVTTTEVELRELKLGCELTTNDCTAMGDPKPESTELT